MSAGPDTKAGPAPGELVPVLDRLGLPHASHLERMPGGSSPVYRVDLRDGGKVCLKTYDEAHGKAPQREAHAAGLLEAAGLPATRYLLVDESLAHLPFRFAVTSYLPGIPLEQLAGQRELAGAYRGMGATLRCMHEVSLPAYGAFEDQGVPGPHATNEAYMSALAEMALTNFRKQGGNPALADRIERTLSDNLDVTRHSRGAVFAHDDFQPGNVLANARDGSVEVTGVIDFGNARASDALCDLAKSIFCTEHMAPGAGALLREGYGPLDHPDPERALWFYSIVHRVIMWFWLRQIGVIGPGQHDGLIDDLAAMLD